MSFSPPPIAPADRPLRRKVALAYRTARSEGKSHDRSFQTAMAVYLAECPGPPLETSERVATMIASAVSVDPEWFWKNLPRSP
jgi:hypothetical protein